MVLLISCVVFGLSLALKVSADATLQPSEAFISVVADRTGKEWGNIRTVVDVSLVIIVAAILNGQFCRIFGKATDKIFIKKGEVVAA